MSIDYKTQTERSTKFHTGVTNINLFVKDGTFNGFEFGIITSKYWGDFEEREEPHITFSIEGKEYQMPLSEFKEKIKNIIV